MILRLIWSRLLHAVPVLFGVTLLTFGMINLLPGGTAETMLGVNATPQSIATLDKEFGLNFPVWDRYWHWLDGAFHLNLGKSFYTTQPVTSLIASRAPVSAELGAFALLIALVFAVPIAVRSAQRQGKLFDRFFTVASLAGISIPAFVLGLALLLVFGLKLGWFPTSGFVPISQGFIQNIRSLVLPAVTLAALFFARFLRVLRGDIVQELWTGHYVETARGKGMKERRVLYRHVLPNALFGLITVVTVNLSLLIGGSVLVESVFAVPGMGNALLSAITGHDSPVVEGIVLGVALVIVASNLLADIIYMVLDPRVRVGHSH